MIINLSFDANQVKIFFYYYVMEVSAQPDDAHLFSIVLLVFSTAALL